MCGFCNMSVFDNCVDVLVICMLVFTVFLLCVMCFCVVLCIFLLICFVCTSVRTTVTE